MNAIERTKFEDLVMRLEITTNIGRMIDRWRDIPWSLAYFLQTIQRVFDENDIVLFQAKEILKKTSEGG